MLKGSQKYNIPVGGFRLLKIEAFEVKFADLPGVESVTVSSSGDRTIEVDVQFANVASIDEARQTAKQIAWRIADRLAFQYGISADDPILGSHSLSPAGDPLSVSVGHHIHLEGTATAFMAGHVKHDVKSAEIPELQSFLPSVEPSREGYYRDYRWTLQQPDPVAKYLHLYRTLLNLTKRNGKEKQEFVDAFIKTVEPQVQFVTPPGRPSETIYSSLRNEVAHDRGAVPEDTKTNIEGRVEALVKIVKEAVLRLA